MNNSKNWERGGGGGQRPFGLFPKKDKFSRKLDVPLRDTQLIALVVFKTIHFFSFLYLLIKVKHVVHTCNSRCIFTTFDIAAQLESKVVLKI